MGSRGKAPAELKTVFETNNKNLGEFANRLRRWSSSHVCCVRLFDFNFRVSITAVITFFYRQP